LLSTIAYILISALQMNNKSVCTLCFTLFFFTSLCFTFFHNFE